MPNEIECVVWCPRCMVDKFEVWRVPLDQNGHHSHRTVPPDIPTEARKWCACGAALQRKPVSA